ncbi:MAG: hypothetical protein IJX66_01310 [Lachnospiraceae bacterium]|nr:hypothetical protein [Lachnospiraceae bacterium]
MKKVSAVITLLLLGGLILGLSVADFFTKDRMYSEYENRMLAKKPQFSLQALFSGSFAEDYEAYITDQFTGRDNWIFIKTMTDVALGKKEVNGVYLAKDGTLIQKHAPEDIDVAEVEKKLVLLKELFNWQKDRQDIGNFYVMTVPTSDNILTEKLPDYAPIYSQSDFIAQIKETIGEEYVIDVQETLNAHGEEKIYYGTDHHWTTLGAYYGYLEWAATLGVKPVDYEVDVVSTNFLGTMHSQARIPVEPDTIEVYIPQVLRGDAGNAMQVYYDLSEESHDTLYEAKYLDTKNQYGYFLDDNHPFIEINTGVTDEEAKGKTLFILKDSYANCFVPFLTEHYETIYVMDLRYFRGKLFPFMEEYAAEGNMDILVLYNVIHFIEEFQYY